MYSPFFDWFGSKRTSVWIQIVRKMVNTIWFQFHSIRFRKNFSVCAIQMMDHLDDTLEIRVLLLFWLRHVRDTCALIILIYTEFFFKKIKPERFIGCNLYTCDVILCFISLYYLGDFAVDTRTSGCLARHHIYAMNWIILTDAHLLLLFPDKDWKYINWKSGQTFCSITLLEEF